MASPPPPPPSSPPSLQPFTITAPILTPYTPGSYSGTAIPRRSTPSQDVAMRKPSATPPPPSDPLPVEGKGVPPNSSYRLSSSTLPFATTRLRSPPTSTALSGTPAGPSSSSPPQPTSQSSSPPSLGTKASFQFQSTYAPPTQQPPQFQFPPKFEQFQPLPHLSTALPVQTPLKPQSVPLAAPTGATRIQLALDYGTTFTGVAYLSVPASRKESELESLLDKIQVIQRWPPDQEMKKVPSQYSYSLTPKGCKQWGYDIDDNSLVLKKTKIQLEEVRERIEELKTLGELLNRLRLLNLTRDEVRKNGVPKHLGKEPEDIVRDYLEKIAEMTAKEISEQIGKKVLENISIDLTVTHPAIWSDRALNSTYRAVRDAFKADLFPQLTNISFVPEPVACAHYTLREAWQTDDVQFNRNDCFIVVDAGGGTVDLASYKVLSIDHVKKQIKLEQVGEPLGDTCGATCVDKSFELWAEEKLGSEDWERLMSEGVKDNATGGHSIVRPNLRRLQDKFTPIKHQFDGKDNKFAWPIQLPRNATVGGTDDASRAQHGALRVTSEDLRTMFDDSVDRTLYLVEQAVEMIEIVEKLKVKKIFLSGGFAQSPYLFQRVKEFGVEHQIEVQRGDDCWIAVAKGAIIKSLGVYTEKPEFVKPCPRHYGIKVRRPFASYENHQRRDIDVDAQGKEWATDQLRWFVQKGDGMFPNKPIMVTHECNFSAKASEFPAYQSKRVSLGNSTSPPVFREIVFVASARDEAPIRVDSTDKVQEQFVAIKCDLTKVPRNKIDEVGDKKSGKTLKFHVKVEIKVLEKVYVTIRSGGTTLVTEVIDL